ncbi:MAG: response regulator [bacterium]
MGIDTSMKVLVVDDFATIRKIIKNVCKKIGFTDIDTAENGKMALSKLEQGDFGLVISDWNMPVMTGIELLEAVRKHPDLKDTPFLMVTAEAEKEKVVRAISAGVSNYIVKPFTPEVLQQKLEAVFKD